MAKNYVDNLGEGVRKGMIERARQAIGPRSRQSGRCGCAFTAETKNVRDGRRERQRALALVEEVRRTQKSREKLAAFLMSLVAGARNRRYHGLWIGAA